MPAKLTARFTTKLVLLEGWISFHILPVPDEVVARYRAAKIRRVIGTVNGRPINRGLQFHADGGGFLTFGRAMLAPLGLKRGQPAEVFLKPDPRADEIEVPEELALVLAEDAAARARWETFTPGFRRSLAYYVSSAKTEPTRIKRSVQLAHKIRTRTLSSDKQRQANAP